MIRHGLAYGLLSTRRRFRSLWLPMLTTATGSFLLVQVLALADTVRAQARALGDPQSLARATILIAVLVLLVGVAEVAICTTRTVSVRTREIGVLGATGVRRSPVVTALLVEPAVAAVTGALAGALVSVLVMTVLASTGLSATGPALVVTVGAVASAVLVSLVAALVTSLVPSWRAASRPPIRSLTSGG